MQQQLFGNNRESGRHDGHGAGFAFFHALIMEKLCFTCDPAKDAATVTYGSRMLAGEERSGRHVRVRSWRSCVHVESSRGSTMATDLASGGAPPC
jgi:hypothetical protein